MPDSGKLPGRYNIVVAEEYDLFDHRVPIAEFQEMLDEDDVPDEVCVVGLDDLFDDDDAVNKLSRVMSRHADNLEAQNPLPTIQFAVEGAFQRRERDYELHSGDSLYRLSRVFGSQINRREQGWLTTPF